MIVKVDQLCAENIAVKHFEFLFLLQSKCDIFRLQICVNDLTNPVQIVKGHESLSGDLTDNGNWNALVVVFLYQGKKVLTEDLERHD